SESGFRLAFADRGGQRHRHPAVRGRADGHQHVGLGIARGAAEVRLPDRSRRATARPQAVVRADRRTDSGVVGGGGRPHSDDRRGARSPGALETARPDARGVHLQNAISRARCGVGRGARPRRAVLRMGDVAQLGARRTLAHVFVRLIGFGMVVTPYVPFRVERASPDGTALAVTTSAGETTLNFRGDTPASVPGIADVVPGAFGGDWWLETSIYRCPWPSRFVLVSTTDPASTAKYDLVGPANSLIY